MQYCPGGSALDHIMYGFMGSFSFFYQLMDL